MATLNRIPSRRRLEREAGRKVKVMWLTGKLAADHKAIVAFRRDSGLVIGKTCTLPRDRGFERRLCRHRWQQIQSG